MPFSRNKIVYTAKYVLTFGVFCGMMSHVLFRVGG